MVGSSKTSRLPPSGSFEDYTLTFVNEPGLSLTENPFSKFIRYTGDAGTASRFAASTGSWTEELPIGFDFNFDGITYKKFVMSTAGWMALVDPATSFNILHLFTRSSDFCHNSKLNIPSATNHVVLAPWFDTLENVPPDDAGSTSNSTNNRYYWQHGMTTWMDPVGDTVSPGDYYTQTDYGLRYLVDTSEQGRRLVVRWNSKSNLANSIRNYNVKFECVVYENGTIEFRYEPLQRFTRLGTFVADRNISATCGIFSGRSATRFRDFSVNLRYTSGTFQRQPYARGGSVYDPSWTDRSILNTSADSGTASFGLNLHIGLHWPSNETFGGMFVFSPPRNKMRVLPRKLRSQIDSKQSSADSLFNDATTLLYSTSVVSYPSLLARTTIATDKHGLTQNELLFQNDISLTASFVKNKNDEFLTFPNTRLDSTEDPFDDRRFEQGSNDPFFVSGTRVEDGIDGFSQPLSAKDQITFSLPVDVTTTMFESTASVYYYTPLNNSWVIPRNSVPMVAQLPRGRDLGNPEMYRDFKVFAEDARGFGPLGNIVASGSTTISTQTSSIRYIGRTIQAMAMSEKYDKNMQLAMSYSAGIEQINVPPQIKHPFLVEKVVINIPVSAGDGWFKDVTVAGRPFDFTGSYNTSFRYIDIGGPAVTVGLFAQQGIPSLQSASSSLDLIASATITHQFDNVARVRVFKDPGMTSYVARTEGMLAHNATPNVVITPVSTSTGYTYTGSIQLNMEATIANGIVGVVEYDLEEAARLGNSGQSVPAATYDQVLSSSFLNQTLNLGSTYTRYATSGSFSEQNVLRTYQINPFGRSSGGTFTSGRSIFGKEFVSPPQIIDNIVSNPLHLADTVTDLPLSISAHIQSGTREITNIFSAVSLQKSVVSPYLLMPNDKLVLAVAKTRPSLYSYGSSSIGATFRTGTINSFDDPSAGRGPAPTQFSGTTGHDFILQTGSIKVTLYGSYVLENKERHFNAKDLTSNALHDVIQTEVLDDFEVNYKGLYTGNYYDDYITGSLASKAIISGSYGILTGTRGKLFSKNNPPQFISGAVATSVTPLSITSKRTAEVVGMLGINQAQSDVERYYDTLLPPITECTKINGGRTYSSPLLNNLAGVPLTSSYGYISFNKNVVSIDNQFNVGIECASLYDHDDTWFKSFPFEPRYGNVKRLLQPEQTYKANKINHFITASNPGSGPFASTIEPESLVQNIFPFIDNIDPSGLFCFGDAVLSQSAGVQLWNRVPVSLEDTFKIIYGIGDGNRMYLDATGSVCGDKDLVTRRTLGGFSFVVFNAGICGPVQRGWRYGIYNALPEYTKAYFRQGRFGQVRDMLEQRKDSKFIDVTNSSNPKILSSPVRVKFVNSNGIPTNPLNTWSQNLSFECTSSLPYFDGEARERPEIDTSTLNNQTFTL